MESRRCVCSSFPMSSRNLGLMALALLAFFIPRSCQDDTTLPLSHCDTTDQPRFIASCAAVSVIRIKQVYTGTGRICPPSPNNRVICVALTEFLRLRCNRHRQCDSPADILQRCAGDTIYVEYECIPIVTRQMNSLTNSSMSGAAVWLLSATYPPQADYIDRQMCHVNINGYGTIWLDFLDLSFDGNLSRRRPYCVYWGESDFVCASKAFERQTFQVRTSSNPQNTPLALLFWSNNYTATTAAKIWIEIRAAAMFTLSVECGLSVLNYPYITTPEPYWLPTAPTNPTTPTNPTSYVTTESATETPASTLESETVPEPQSTTDDTFSETVIIGVLVAVFLLVIILLYICVYRRHKNKQPDDTPVGLSETTASRDDTIHRVDNVYMISSGDEAAVTDSVNGRLGSDFANVYDAIDAPQEQPKSVDLPQPTGPLYSQVMKGNMSRANNTPVSYGPYDHIQSPDKSTLSASQTPSQRPAETPPMAIYSQVNKPKKRASSHPEPSGKESGYKSMGATYEQTGSSATDTGEIDLIENDLYETSEAVTNRK